MKKAVFKARARPQDVIGELESALERAGGNSLVEHFLLRRFALVPGFPRTANAKSVFLGFDREIRRGEARHRHRDPVGVLASAFDIIGRVTWHGFKPGGLIDHIEQAVEPDGRAVKGRKIKLTHLTILLE